jgi:trigger factor
MGPSAPVYSCVRLSRLPASGAFVKTIIERVDDTTVKLSVTVEAERVREAVEGAARALASQVKVPGFRPGRVPRRVLESRLGKDALLQEAVRDALPVFYSDAARAENLAVVGPPRFEVDTFEEGKEAVFHATVEVRPDIAVPDYRGLPVPHPEWEVTDEELAEQLDALRERFAELETVTRPARPGDYALLTISGTLHGRRVEQASAEDTLYEIHDPQQSESELDRHLVGAVSGAILRFNDTLGPDYGELAGKELSFTAIVKEVKAKRLPPLDDDFAVTASEFDTLEELRGSLREQLSRPKRAYAEQALRGRVVEAVTEQVDVAVPRSLVASEVRFRRDQIARQAEQFGLTVDEYLQRAGTAPDDLHRQLEDEARKTVKAQLVVDAIGRDAEIEVGEEDLAMEIARQAARLGRPPQELAKLMTAPEHIGALYSDAYRRKAIDHLLSQVEVVGGPPEAEPPEAEPPETEPAEAEREAPEDTTVPPDA